MTTTDPRIDEHDVQRTITFGAFPDARFTVKVNRHDGFTSIRANDDNGKEVFLSATLEELQEIFAAIGATIRTAEQAIARRPDHDRAVEYLGNDALSSVTINQEAVHRTADNHRCIVCHRPGHDVGLPSSLSD